MFLTAQRYDIDCKIRCRLVVVDCTLCYWLCLRCERKPCMFDRAHDQNQPLHTGALKGGNALAIERGGYMVCSSDRCEHTLA